MATDGQHPLWAGIFVKFITIISALLIGAIGTFAAYHLWMDIFAMTDTPIDSLAVWWVLHGVSASTGIILAMCTVWAVESYHEFE